jgi:hypothetical protein
MPPTPACCFNCINVNFIMRGMNVDLARRYPDRSCELPGGIHAVSPAGHRRLSHPQPLHPGRGHQGVPGLANRWLLPRFCSGFSSRWLLPRFNLGSATLAVLVFFIYVHMQGRREEEELLDFISRFLIERVITLWPGNYDKWVKGKT